ncbi:Glucose and ribitol dehydrogenase, partial [Ananas comosus]
GKVAVVTGGDSGIGRAVCYCFAQEGATVAFTYVESHEDKDAKDTLQMLRDITKKHGTTVHAHAKEPMAIPADLGCEENCKRAVDEVVDAYGRVDVLVNNAGEQHVKECITEITAEQLDRGGSIINTTSVNAYKGNAKLLDYTATKGAIVGFTRGLALQLAERGIRVNGVAPGPVWTPLIPSSFAEEKVASFGGEVPMKRAGQPIEIAPSYVFLASFADSSYISGQVLHPNGGVIVNG